jgi:tellurite resistance protein
MSKLTSDKTVVKIPLNLLGIPFGLAGLADIWVTMANYHQVPASIGEALLALAALVWSIVIGAYVRYALLVRGALLADLVDPMAGPFASLALITPMLLAALGLYPHAASAGAVLVDCFLALTVIVGGWFTGQWIYGRLELDQLHPGYFLPTVAGGMIASFSAAHVGQHRLGEAMFGLGLICWLVLGSIILGRLLIRPSLPEALTPTLAIEVAPAAVASLAYFALNGDRIDFIVAAIGGYGLLMVLAQLRLLPAYLRLRFMPSLWAFTFSWGAVATASLIWLIDSHPPGYRIYSYLLLAGLTAGIGALAGRTGLAVIRRQLLTPPPTRAAGQSMATGPQPVEARSASAGVLPQPPNRVASASARVNTRERRV